MARFQDMLTRGQNGNFLPITVGDGVELSIQGSESHYSSPRFNCEFFSVYQEMEMAIFRDGAWATLTQEAQARLGCRDEGIYRGSQTTVFPYIPVDTIQAVFDAIAADPSIVISISESVSERGLCLPEPEESGGYTPGLTTGYSTRFL